MVDFNTIVSANELIKTTPIKGKDYAEVPQRIKAFRYLYPDGTIQTELISNDNGVCVFKATVGYYTEVGDFRVLGTGTAYEKESSSFINKTSYIENCETSAVGRALGMCGLGVDTSIASYEEVSNAIENQNKPPQKCTENQAKAVAKLIVTDEQKAWLEKHYKTTNPADLTIEQASEVISLSKKGK